MVGMENRGVWDGYNKKRENNVLWSENPLYHFGNEYQMNQGRRIN